MAGIVAQYTQVPRMRRVVTNVVVPPVVGVNPVDIGAYTLPNVRGQLLINGVASDSGLQWSFQAFGGFGDFPGDFTQNFFLEPGTEINCTVTQPIANLFRIVTPVGDAGGRVYDLQFYPVQSVPPTIRQTSVNIIGPATFTLQLIKNLLIEGF